MRPVFPFDAVVGHDDAKLALRLAAIDPLLGGVLLRGEKGSAKTTLARGLAALLGDAPFVELPLGATEDRLVGTLDTRAALTEGEIRFRPGLLAEADGGVLYVDEINLLPDHLVDVLLDVAVSGENRVERDGVSHRHPARFVLVGSMNPEEGELRPQLLDRFGLCVSAAASTDLDERAEAVRRRLAFDRGDASPAVPPPGERSLRDVGEASIGDDVIGLANRLAVEVGAEGLRADLTLCRAAGAHAAWRNRTAATVDDVVAVAPLVLAHRCRRAPFDPPVLPPDALDDAIERATTAVDDTADGGGDDESDEHPDTEPTTEGPDPDRRPTGTNERPLTIGAMRRPADTFRPRAVASTRGRVVGDVAAGAHDPIAVLATARRRAESGGDGPEDIRTATRVAAPQRTIVFCVDLSGSMGAQDRADAATGTVLGLLTGAYERRDKVSLVTFRGDDAEVVLSPTSSVEVARHRLAGLVTGGETPLAEGLSSALGVARRATVGGSNTLLAILTDGRATGSPDAFDRALQAADAIRAAAIDTIVLDCESGTTRLGLAARLAETMQGRLVHVDTLVPENIARTLG